METQWKHSENTVETSGNTVETHGNTVETQWKHSGNTVETQWKHTGNTVETQWKHSGNTVETQANTVKTQLKHSLRGTKIHLRISHTARWYYSYINVLNRSTFPVQPAMQAQPLLRVRVALKSV